MSSNQNHPVSQEKEEYEEYYGQCYWEFFLTHNNGKKLMSDFFPSSTCPFSKAETEEIGKFIVFAVLRIKKYETSDQIME